MSNKPTSLPALAKQANEEHEAALGCAHAALDHAMEAGRLLAEAKVHVAHGGWLPWLEEHFKGGRVTAWRYMRLYQHRDELASDVSSAKHLGIHEALAYLAEPAEPEPDEEPPEGGDGNEVDPASIPLGTEKPVESEEPVAKQVIECPDCGTLVPKVDGAAEYTCPACEAEFTDESPEPDDEPNTPEAIADAEGLPEPTPQEIADAEGSSEPEPDAEAEADAVPRDPYGTALEPAVAEAFARKGELTGLMHRLSKAKTDVLRACDEGDPLYAPILPARIKADLENARWQIAACIPHAACPHCRQIGCDVCQGRGYVSEEVYKRYQAAQARGTAYVPPEPEPEPEPESDEDGPEGGNDDEQAPCAFCGKPSWFTFECKKCGNDTAVCEACEDQSKAELCPDCLEAKAE